MSAPAPTAAPLREGRLWLPWLTLMAPLVLLGTPLAYDDHVEPAALLLEQGRLPAADACWECHQPPLYYVLEALAFRALGADTPAARRQAAAALGGLLALGMALSLGALLRRSLADPSRRLLVLALALTFPAFVLLAMTLGNDVPAAALATLVLAWIARGLDPGRQPPRAWAWGLAGALAGLAVLAKTTALPALGALAWAAGTVAVRRQRGWAPLLAALAGFGLTLAPWLTWNWAQAGHLLPLRMQTQAYDPPTWGYLASFRPLALLAEPFRDGPTATVLDHLRMPRPVDGSLWTRFYSLWFNEALHVLPPLWPPLVAALYGLGSVVVGLVGVGAWRVARQPVHPADRPALVLLLASLALVLAFNVVYPSTRLVHGKAVFAMPAFGAVVLLYARGLDQTLAWAGRRAGVRGRVAVYCAHFLVQALFLAHALLRTLDALAR